MSNNLGHKYTHTENYTKCKRNALVPSGTYYIMINSLDAENASIVFIQILNNNENVRII